MSNKYNGKVNFGGIFHPTGATPLDDRTVVETKNDLMTLGSSVYKGMTVSVLDEGTVYYLDGDECTPLSNWKKICTHGSEFQWEDLADTIE